MSSVSDSAVASFYSGKSVFITGGTGFVGKTLIEKLMYSCSGIDKIYVLVRDKYGKQASERLERITSTPDTKCAFYFTQAFVHVSTAFTNSDRKEIYEVVYPMPMKIEDARYIAEMYSHDDRIIKELMGKKPNTYTFSKAFAEEQVMKQCEDLPAAIVRPSIVISALKEPCPGCIDTWNGSTGLIVGMSTGVLKVAKGRGSNVTDLVPVDIVTNLLIVVATECQKSKEMKVYNCSTGASNPITYDQASATTKRVSVKHSLNEFPWVFNFIMFTPSLFLYNLITFAFQIIPAYLIDLLR